MKHFEEYNDETILTKGKLRFIPLGKVDPRVLIEIFETKSKGNMSLFNYVEKNIESIRSRFYKTYFPNEEQNIDCRKVKYISKKVANSHIEWISKNTKGDKVPIRSYQCDKCTAWHVTSMQKFELNK